MKFVELDEIALRSREKTNLRTQNFFDRGKCALGGDVFDGCATRWRTIFWLQNDLGRVENRSCAHRICRSKNSYHGNAEQVREVKPACVVPADNAAGGEFLHIRRQIGFPGAVEHAIFVETLAHDRGDCGVFCRAEKPNFH